MKNFLKRFISIMLTMVMVFGSAPLAGLIGIELPSITDLFSSKAEAATSGTCGDSLTWDLNGTTGVLTISGTGDMKDYTYSYSSSSSSAPWYSQRSKVTSVTIGSGVTSIGYYAFSHCESLTSITIPDSVTSIGNYAFYYCERLTSITFGENSQLTSIGEDAFSHCESLTSITFGENSQLTSIGEDAFSHCESLTSITIPDSVTSIGNYAFYYCERLTSITIPDSVKSIGDYAFYNCSKISVANYPGTYEDWQKVSVGSNNGNLTSKLVFECNSERPYYGKGTCGDSLTWVLHPNGELVIDGTGNMKDYSSSSSSSAPWYSQRSKVTSVTIGSGVTSIGNYAFYDCTSLTSITIPDSVKSIGNSAFFNTAYYNNESNWENGVLYIGKHLIKARGTVSGSYAIKDGTKIIADDAFYNCKSLASITIPDSVTSIGEDAFSHCESLTSITIPDSVTSIGNYAFYYCERLTSITIPDSVKSIGDYAFYNCSKISVANYPGTYEDWQKVSVGSNNGNLTSKLVFECNSERPYYGKGTCGDSLTWVLHPNGELVIDGTGDMKDYTYSYSSSSSSAPWYSQRSKVTSVTIGSGVTSIGYYAFSHCESLTSITIPDSVTSIGNYAFFYCESLTSITIPDSVKSIGGYAFRNCENLESITFGENSQLTSIGEDAFSHCESLTSITIPDSVTSIGNYAFYYCERLTSITIPDSVKSIGDYAFYNCSKISVANYPGTYEDWQKVSVGSNNGNLTSKLVFECNSERPYYGKGTCGDSLTWVLHPNGELVIDGTGDMSDYSLEKLAPWDEKSERIKTVSIGSGVTKIGDYAFAECNNIEKVIYDGNAEEWKAVSKGTKNENLTGVTAKFSEYMLSWVIDGEITGNYVEVGAGLTPPDVAPKANFSFIGWSPAVPDEMPANDMIFTAVFIKSCVCPYCGDEILGEEAISVHLMQEEIINSTVTIKNNSGSKTINYGETLRLTAIATKPADAKIVWYVDGVKKGEGETFDVSFDSGTKTVEAKFVDANGNILKDKNGNEISTAEKVTVNAGLWQKIVSFFKNLFGSDRTVVQ